MPRKRAPHGVVTERPIALRLLPDELKQVQELAAAEKRPVANMCRLIVMQGIKTYRVKPISPDLIQVSTNQHGLTIATHRP